MKLDLRQPCNDCPFRRNARPGWLGPWEPNDLLFSLVATPFPCHQTIDNDGQEFEDDSLQGCAGAAIFLNNKVELSRCPETAEHQAKLKDVPAAVAETVFQWAHEFTEHHTTNALTKAGDGQ